MMNSSVSTIIISLVIILAIPYLISVIRKVQNHNIPFIKALNPSYTKAKHEEAEFKRSYSPIVQEIETQQLAKLIKHWTAKFENGSLSEQDVIELNARIEAGGKDQVNGILALHPEGKKMFKVINERLKLKAEDLAAIGSREKVLA